MTKSIVVWVCLWCGCCANAETLIDQEQIAWRNAAKSALTIIGYRNDQVMTYGDNISISAENALKQWGKILPAQAVPAPGDDRISPPILRVNRFEKQGDEFEFEATTGAIGGDNHLRCGTTTRFRIKYVRGKGWRQVGPTWNRVC